MPDTSTQADLAAQLADIRKKIEQLDLARPAYAGLLLQKRPVRLQIKDSENLRDFSLPRLNPDSVKDVAGVLAQSERNLNVKIIAAGIDSPKPQDALFSRLWLTGDIVSFFGLPNNGAEGAQINFTADNVATAQVDENNRVWAHDLVGLEDYRLVSPKDEFEPMRELAGKFSASKIIFISATPQGGGVALMRHGLMRLFKQLNIDASWFILIDRPEVFDVTKTKFHNILQAVAAPETVLTEDDKKIYHTWIEDNFTILAPAINQADLIVIDDPQPAGLIPRIKQANPSAKIVYRSHIQIESALVDTKGTPQSVTWDFLWDFIRHADVFVAHPVAEFVPRAVPRERLVYMPPSTDLLDGLNKPLSDRHLHYYTGLFNKFLLESAQEPLDPVRPFAIQIARFDPSKGIPDVLEVFRQVWTQMKAEKRTLPQLVICGNGSVDDPDRGPMFNLVKDILRQDQFAPMSADIKVIILPHVDQILNALLRQAKVAFQLSHKEGFEIKVTESLMKGVPVLAFRAGGIPLQIADGKTGFLAEVGDVETIAHKFYQLLTEPDLLRSMSASARLNHRRDLSTVSNALRWLQIFEKLLF